MKFIFLSIFRFFSRNRTAFWAVLILSFVCTGYLASRIHPEEDITSILPADKKLEKMNQVFQESKFADRMVMSISLRDTANIAPDQLISFADSFVPQLQSALAPFIQSLQAKVDEEEAMTMLENVQQQLPLYLEKADYSKIDSLIQPQVIKSTLEDNIRILSSPAGFALGKIIRNDPSGISFIALRKLEKLKYDDNLLVYDNYLLSADQKNLLIYITPKFPPGNTGKNALFIRGLDSLIESQTVKNNHPVHVDYFGSTVVSLGNAMQLRKDALITQGITVLFLIIFLALYFRKKRAPVLILVPVLFGSLFSLALISLIQGSVSVIAIGTGSIVLGIAVNYSLHVFNHYRHVPDMEQVISDLSFPMTIGGLTTVGGFLCLQFTASAMLRDLGLFAAFSLIGAALASLIFLPHLIRKSAEEESYSVSNASWIDKLASYRPEGNKYLVLPVLALTVFFIYFANRVGFESDMMNMNFMSEKVKAAEKKFNDINAYALQSVYLVSEGKSREEALRKNEIVGGILDSLRTAGVVNKFSGVSGLVLSDSLKKEKISSWEKYWTTEKKTSFLQTIAAEGSSIGYKPGAFNTLQILLEKNYLIADSVENRGSEEIANNFITEKNGRTNIVSLARVTPANKKTVYSSFEGNEGVTVLDKQYITSRLVEIINADFGRIALYTSLLVFFVLLITYGRIELALVSFIPMLITWLWILGIMGLLGLQFNIINIIISALIFGLGDDYSLFIMDGLINEYRTGKKNLSSYKSAIVLSAITTIAGLGVLIFAKHPALRSIALISIIGIASVAIIAQVLIPFFFSLLITKRVRVKHFPWTLSGFFLTVFAFVYFVTGCLLCTVVGLLLYVIKPFAKEPVKHFYHIVISKFCWSLMYIMANQRKRIVNRGGEDFKKPAIIICNHQSFLDILSMIMLHPKLILFTNQWVWNSPVFGAVVRMADYFPVAKGVENSIELVADRVKHGYSVVIFPEGTRTIDGSIKRFHKGAFFLAEQLGLDILPIVIHGTSYAMTKGDFLLKNGTISVNIMPRIKPSDPQWGNGYAERAKGAGRYFRNQYARVRRENEQTAFFRETLKYNYIYKGPVLEWYMKVKTALEKNYQQFHELLPLKGHILDIGCGYGFLSYMLYLTSRDRRITGIDYDEEKIDTANHCFIKDEHVNFEHTDVLKYSFEVYDGIVLSDVLHYLPAAKQKAVISKCIDHLGPNGVIVIRDGNAELEKKHKGTKVTEFFSTRLIGFNKTTAEGLSFLSGAMIREVAAENDLECIEIDQTKFTSNMLFVLKKGVFADGA
jgi:1-acyl-sn-glycerol-3-phosphate acyltransferase